jgi:cysteine desulfurase
VAAIVGLAAALEAACREQSVVAGKLALVREQLWQGLVSAIPGLHRNTPFEGVLCNTLNICVPGVSAEDVLIGSDLEGLSLSSGSACLVGSVEPSHVLRAMGVPPELARGAVRFSLGSGTESEDVAEIVERFRRVVKRLQEKGL